MPCLVRWAMACCSSVVPKHPIRRLLVVKLRLLSSSPHLSTPPLPLPYPPPSSSGSHSLTPMLPRAVATPRVFFSSSHVGDGPAKIDYSLLLTEEEYQKLADDTIEELHEKIEVYGDEIQLDGFDIDYGNQVLTIKLGDLGTYVINKQTPNRQIWLSSPVSGPSRFDWDSRSRTWIYRRTKAHLLQILQEELGTLCGKPVRLC